MVWMIVYQVIHSQWDIMDDTHARFSYICCLMTTNDTAPKSQDFSHRDLGVII